jgi:hypothetical protein
MLSKYKNKLRKTYIKLRENKKQTSSRKNKIEARKEQMII